jgi:hypothetical protein
MNCLEAQSKIVTFIEDKLNDDETVEFVRHIRNCENCAEELEIYYTLLVGMKQLDEDQELSTNFKEQMEQKLNVEYKHVQNRRKVTGSTVVIILAGIFIIGFLGFEGHRATLYQQEQEAIKEAQSEYYYADYFKDELFHTEDYSMFNFENYISSEDEKLETTYYERLKSYLNTHPVDTEDMNNNLEDSE